MRVDALAVTLRPRPMGEAADLGQRLVQAHAASVWRCFTPVWAAVLLLALSTLEIASWLPGLLLFCAKPWLDRTLLYVFSRAVFGESTSLRTLWEARGPVWGRQFVATWTLGRLSPWRAYTQPIGQLEGLRGRAWRQRRKLLLSGHREPAGRLQFVYANGEMLLALALFSLPIWFLPGNLPSELWQAYVEGKQLLLQGVVATGYGLVVLLLEPFYVAAGFAMYLNRRVELEAWDVEQELRHALA